MALPRLFPFLRGSSFQRLLFSLSWQQKSSLTLLSTAKVGRAALATITPVPAAGPILATAGVAALPLPPRKTQKMLHQEQIARQNKRKRRAIQGQAHARQIAICGPNRTSYPGQKTNHTTINHWVSLWSTNQTWDGKAALYVAMKNRGKNQCFGGGLGMANASGRPISMGLPARTPQTHHNQTRLGWVGAESARGWRSGCVLWCAFFWNFGQRGFLMASLNCDRAGKFDHSTRLLASTM